MQLFVFISISLIVANCENAKTPEQTNQRCLESCHPPNKVACETGCKIAGALTLAPKDYAHNPSCHDSCESMFPKLDEQQACISGCDHFKESDDINSLSPLGNFFHHCRSRLVDMFNRFRDAIHPTQSISGTPEESSGNTGIVKTHIRLFIFPNPTLNGKPNDDSADQDVAPMEHFPFAPKTVEDSSFDSPAHISRHRFEGTSSKFSWEFACRLHRVLANPLKLLFALTIIALFFLLLTQVVLHMRRRRHRSLGYQYTALPTYAEAVEVKIPFDTKESQGKDAMCFEKQEGQLKA